MDLEENFGAVDFPYSDYEKARVVIFPVSFEGTLTYGKGTNKAPRAIIEASKNMELFENGKNIFEAGIFTDKGIEAKEKKVEEVLDEIYGKSKKFLDDNKFIVMLGGEHSITQALVKAYKEKFPDISVLQIDAHSDLRDEYDFSKFSHACVMKRVYEMGIPIVQVGIRSTSEEEREVFEKNKENIFLAEDIVNSKDDKWVDEVVSKLSKNIFITIDVDAFDISIMPAVGTPEPGGLGWYEVLKLLKKVSENKNVVGFDVVELAPIEGLYAYDFLCAKLIYKLIGYVFSRDL